MVRSLPAVMTTRFTTSYLTTSTSGSRARVVSTWSAPGPAAAPPSASDEPTRLATSDRADMRLAAPSGAPAGGKSKTGTVLPPPCGVAPDSDAGVGVAVCAADSRLALDSVAARLPLTGSAPCARNLAIMCGGSLRSDRMSQITTMPSNPALISSSSLRRMSASVRLVTLLVCCLSVRAAPVSRSHSRMSPLSWPVTRMFQAS
mmetsp:Transcript_6286/g.15578  ORF Transcript_6286/g.15578 Transcript_6286/m.15578 type:complete len:203 (-) Transcript_6286:1354-1962(-)